MEQRAQYPLLPLLHMLQEPIACKSGQLHRLPTVEEYRRWLSSLSEAKVKLGLELWHRSAAYSKHLSGTLLPAAVTTTHSSALSGPGWADWPLAIIVTPDSFSLEAKADVMDHLVALGLGAYLYNLDGLDTPDRWSTIEIDV